MTEDELIDKHNKMVMDIINQCNYIIENRKYLTDIGIKNTVSKIRDIVNYYYIKEPEEEPEEAAVKYVRAILEFPELYASTGHEEDFLRGIEKTKIEKVLNELEKKDKIINAMALQLSGISIWDDQKEEPLILMTEKEVKQYFENEVKDD